MPFKEAAAEAGGIVRVRVAGDQESAVRFEVVESMLGRDIPTSILVSRSLWDVDKPKNLPPGKVTYLVLLRQGEEFLCGHINGLIVLSHGCVGILPVIDGAIPMPFAKYYDEHLNGAISLRQVKADLRSMTERGKARASSNHRLHLTSGGGLAADRERLRSPAAGEAER